MFLAPREGRLGGLLYRLNLGIHAQGIFFLSDHNDEKNGLDASMRLIGCSLRTKFRMA